MTFTDYCQANNIQLLPDDIKFIRRMLKHTLKPHQKVVMRRYVKIWVNAKDECKKHAQAQNEGIRADNLFILEVCD